ncbi:MAG: Flp pilus assembly protein CpaB [Halothiobacillus sp.]
MRKINRNVLYVALALLLGGVASTLAVHYINQEVALNTKAPETHKMSKVVVPTGDLKTGEVLSADNLATRDVPSDYVPADALTPDDYGNYLGRVLRVPMSKGAPIPASSLELMATHFSDIIQTDQVAYTIEVNETNSISGLIVPGDHIDILLIMSKDSKDNIRPLLSNVLVLATGKRARGVRTTKTETENSYSNLTLELSPSDAQRIGMAKKIGQLLVMLRSPQTQIPLDLKTFSEADLLGIPRRAGDGIEFIIGGSH